MVNVRRMKAPGLLRSQPMFLNFLSHLRTSTLGVALLVSASFLVASSARAQVWTPPIGIPAPSFGITEVAPATPNPWTVSTAGFYYVDAAKTGATDTSNTYGTPAKPRRTIPTVLPAGAVVEMHGTYDQSHSNPATIVAQGTASRPVFIRGVSITGRPIVRRFWEVRGTYLIIENLEFGPLPGTTETGSMVILLPSSHVVLRHSDLHGTPNDGGLGIVNWEIGYGEVYTGTGVIDNVVVYHNTIHDNGDLNATFDQDVHGIGVSDHVNHLWVLDNQLYRNSGDGIQINAAIAQHAASTHHIYVGRNVSHHNKQAGYWVKQATDVIFSQNTSYGHRPSNSSMGQCIGGQYAPDYAWFLYNHLYDCEFGVAIMSDENEVSHMFVIGNLIHNIHRTVSDNPADDPWGPAGVFMSGGNERHIVNNTIWDVDAGVNIATWVGSLDLSNNIIGNVTLPGASHLLLAFDTLGANTSLHHDLLFGDARINTGNGQVHLTAGQLTQMQSTSSDPRFVNAAGGDFHLQSSSPAVGAGSPNSAYATFQQRYGLSIAVDIDGTPRPATAYALGAYEKVCATAAPIPGAPLGFTASATSTAITLQWTLAAAVGCTAAPSYILEIGSATGLRDLANAPVGVISTMSIPVAGVPAGSYYFRVRATNAAGTSAASNEVPVVFGAAPVVPGVPGTLSSTMTTTTMKLTWAVPTTGTSVTAYLLEAGSAPGAKDRGTLTLSASGTVLSGNKPPRGTYYFRVRAQNAAGIGGSTNEVKIVIP